MLYSILGLLSLFLRTMSQTNLGAWEARKRNYLLSALPSLTNKSFVCKGKVSVYLSRNNSDMLSKTIKEFQVTYFLGLA